MGLEEKKREKKVREKNSHKKIKAHRPLPLPPLDLRPQLILRGNREGGGA